MKATYGLFYAVSIALAQVSPGSRSRSVMKQTDVNTLYIFGGLGLGNNATFGHLSDLWKFDIPTSKLSFLKGLPSIGEFATFGTIPSSSNQPGARSGASSTFLNSQIYIFGGGGYVDAGRSGLLADMWVLNTTTVMWTYLGGSQALNDVGIYGAANSYSTGFRPGGRSSAGMSPNKDGTELIIFGGSGRDANTISGGLGDVWFYRLSDGAWAYKAGHTVIDEFGTLSGLPSNHNPGTRDSMIFECKPGAEMCYIFGGQGFNNAASGYLNDLWSFNQTSAIFSSLARGDYDAVNVAGTYGQKGLAAPGNAPGSRADAASYFDISNNRIVVYGGLRFIPPSRFGYYNDVWIFNLNSGNWAWVSGTGGVVESPMSDINGPRCGHSVASLSSTSFYAFGGYGFNVFTNGYFNDLRLHTIPDNWSLVGG